MRSLCSKRSHFAKSQLKMQYFSSRLIAQRESCALSHILVKWWVTENTDDTDGQQEFAGLLETFYLHTFPWILFIRHVFKLTAAAEHEHERGNCSEPPYKSSGWLCECQKIDLGGVSLENAHTLLTSALLPVQRVGAVTFCVFYFCRNRTCNN